MMPCRRACASLRPSAGSRDPAKLILMMRALRADRPVDPFDDAEAGALGAGALVAEGAHRQDLRGSAPRP